MRRAACLLLVIALVLSLAIPSFANEIEEPQYGAINVEYTDAIGSIEQLNVMVLDSHLYADANILSERLGYKCMQEGDVVSIYTDYNLFSQRVPFLEVHFSVNSTDVSYNPMTGVVFQYTAPAPCVVNDKGVWVPLAYTLVLLGGNSTALTDALLIQMPQDNVLSVATSIACYEQYLSFDWVDDFGYSETTTDITNGAARIVTLFNGLLKFDGASWLSLVDWSAFDRKFGNLLVTMFCTYSKEELDENVWRVEALLDVLSEDGKFGSLLHNKQARLDSDVTAWQTACEEYLNILEDGSGSPAKYNLLYRQYERAMDKRTLFATLGGEGMAHIQDELSSATNVLDIASILSTTVSYLSEFQQKDEYMFSVLKNYLRQRTKTDDLPDGTAQAMQNYLNVMDLGALGYGAYRYIEENWLKCIVDESGLDMVLGAPANVLLFAWDIMSGTIPFYSDGLDAVKNREISNYAQKLQNDALVNLNNVLGELKYSSTISKDDCIRLSEYCYVYLKACYIARATAIKALDNTSEEFQNQIKGKLNTETDINKIIVHYLAILSSADAQNSGYILGFLPENNAEYLNDYSDKEDVIEITFDGEASGQARNLKKINRYDENGTLKQETIFNYSANGTLINAVDRELDQTGSVVHEAVIPFTFDEKGRLTEIGTADSDYYYYDTAGYVYNNSDQLISSFLASGGGSDITYEYDDQGRLVRKYEDDFSAPITIETFFYYDDDIKNEICAKEITTSSWDGESPTVEEKAYVYSLNGNGRVVTICGESDIITYRYEYWPIVIEEHVNSDTGYVYQELNYVDRMGKSIWSMYLSSAISEEQTFDNGSLNKVNLNANSGTVTYEFVYDELSSKDADSTEQNIFNRIPSGFTFASGAGGWGTSLNIKADGTFSGEYHDSDMGITGPGYSNGTVSICKFSGKFTEPEKIDEFTYSMNIESLDVEGTPNTTYYENDTRYIVTEPYGMDSANDFYIYLPGANIEELPEGFLSWAHLNNDIRQTLPSGFYGIYNVGGEAGFVAMDDNNIWYGNYMYYHQDRKSALWPKYDNVSHLLFWPESGAATIDLQFTWSNDNQTEFEAYDTNGSGDYYIALDISDDLSTVVVTVTSENKLDLSAWGGTPDGHFTAQYVNE